jgi:hypothetical protein
MAKKNTCGKCAHWTRIEFGEPHAGKCASDKFIYGDQPPKDGLTYWDYESYKAGFETGEDFGCIHFSDRVTHTQS